MKMDTPEDEEDRLSPECGDAFRGRMQPFDDQMCSKAKGRGNHSRNKTFGRERFGVIKEENNDGDFRSKRCQKVQSEDTSDEEERPRRRGMKLFCNQDKSLEMQVFDDDKCSGAPSDERRMSKGDAKKFRKGECGGFHKEGKGNESSDDATNVVWMKKEGMGAEITVPDCENPIEFLASLLRTVDEQASSSADETTNARSSEDATTDASFSKDEATDLSLTVRSIYKSSLLVILFWTTNVLFR